MHADVSDLDDDFLLRALDSLRDVFAVFDEGDRLVYWNEHAKRRSGYSADELAGMRPDQLVADTDLPKLREYLKQVHQTGKSTVEIRLVAKSGERVPYELYSDLLTDRDGRVIGRVVVGRDVSERLAYERILEHKNDRLSEFARFVSHDIRNPLAVAAAWLGRYHETGDEAHYRRVVTAHRRIEEIVEDLLGMTSHVDCVENAERVDLETVAREAWRTVRSGDAQLRIEESVTVVADRGLLTEALENLFTNAVQHGGEAVTVVVVGTLATDTGFYLEDDGTGFPDESESLLQPGVTTRPDGTGLGLAIVAEIAAMHGWSVDTTSGDDGGARIEFGGVDVR
jgi:PAS domain S-box-containing protein